MTGAAQEPASVPQNLATTAIHWRASEFGTWLRTGLDCWFHPLTSAGERAVAFRPQILNPDRDPVAPLLDTVEAIPGGRERFREAVSESLATWTGDAAYSGDVLGALLRLARRLPAPRQVSAVRRLLFDGYLNDQPAKELLALRVLEAAFELVALPEGEAFLRELRRSERWRPAFAATWLEGMTRAGKIDWFDGLLELRADLERIDPTADNLQPVFGRMANRAGDPDALLARLQALDGIDPWLENLLFGGERPALTLTRIPVVGTKNAPVLVMMIGGEIAALYDDPTDRERNKIFHQIFSRCASEHLPGARIIKRSYPPRGRSPERITQWLAADQGFFTSSTVH